MRRATSQIVLATAFLVAACQSVSPTPSVVYKVLPSAGPIPSKDDTGRAIDVFSARLRSLGITTFTATGGEAITFVLPPTVSDAQVQAILSASGQVSFVPLGPWSADHAVEGEPPPPNEPELFGDDQIAGASVEASAIGDSGIRIRLKEAGARLLADYTSAHIGDLFAVVLDGRIVVLPTVAGAILDGNVTISMPHQMVVPIESMVAIFASGPLPVAWQKAQVSRQ